MRLILSLALIFLAGSVQADDRVPLNEDPQLEYGLRVMAQGYFMRNNCDAVSMRFFKALGLVNSLKSRGRDLGYSTDEMQAYLDDEAQKARIEALARAELQALGVDFEDTATYCPVALAQIEAEQGFGLYFRAN